ncbi:MAG: Asp23/Gls24 family envelope stress response protein [Tissierellia bacterium]|nr:Asp23/Gls24 family envelope stress response protein [Tissierellia bacterium]
MSANFTNDMGTIIIQDNVIATIAGVSAMGTYGIVGMAAKNATDGLFELLKFENLSRGIKVSSENRKITIDIHVILQYGVNISVVADNLIDKVRFNVEEMTGLEVKDIHLHVQGIRLGE